MCVQRSLYPAFYLTTRIFESKNQVCKRFIYFPQKLSCRQAERYSAFRSEELSSQLFRGHISQGPVVLQTDNNCSQNHNIKLLSEPRHEMKQLCCLEGTTLMTKGKAHGCCMEKGSRDCVSHLEHFSLMVFGTTTSNSDSSWRTTAIQTDLRNEGLDHLTTQRKLARFDHD